MTVRILPGSCEVDRENTSGLLLSGVENTSGLILRNRNASGLPYLSQTLALV